jgi:hypothetical protein
MGSECRRASDVELDVLPVQFRGKGRLGKCEVQVECRHTRALLPSTELQRIA